MHLEATDGTLLYAEHLGAGRPLLLLSGGPGCANYMRPVAELIHGRSCLLPDPRGVGGSGGGPHDLATAVADLEAWRRRLGAERWDVLGHSWGADLGLAYALAHPQSVSRLISFAGTGLQNDRDWKAAYEAAKGQEPALDVGCDDAVHRALLTDWRAFIKAPDLLARLSRLPVPTTFLHMGADIRPSWPAEQLAHLLPQAEYVTLPGAPHNAWLTHAPELGEVLSRLLQSQKNPR